MRNFIVSRKEYIGYFSYGFGQCLSFGLLGTFILFFYTDVLSISAAVASVIFLIARIWDACIDPIVAGFMDTHRTNEGKFKGYMKWVPIFICISTVLCFVAPDISVTGKILYAAATYILWGTVYAFSDIPFWSLSTVISNDSQTRTKLITTANLGVYVGIGMSAIIFPLLLSMLKNNGSQAKQYMMATALLMVVSFICMRIGYLFTKERVEPVEREPLRVKDVVTALKANRYMFIVLIIYFMNIFMNIVQGIIHYFFIYNMNNGELMSVFGLLGSIAIIGFFFIPMLTRRFQKRQLLIVFIVCEMITRIIFYIVGYESVTLVLIFLCMTIFWSSMVGPLVSTMLAETVEYSEVKTGKRAEAIVFGGQTFAGKLSIAFAGALTGGILTFIGYVPNAAQSVETLQGIFITIALLPIVGCVIRIVLLIPYKFTEDEYAKCVKALAERRMQFEQSK